MSYTGPCLFNVTWCECIELACIGALVCVCVCVCERERERERCVLMIHLINNDNRYLLYLVVCSLSIYPSLSTWLPDRFKEHARKLLYQCNIRQLNLYPNIALQQQIQLAKYSWLLLFWRCVKDSKCNLCDWSICLLSHTLSLNIAISLSLSLVIIKHLYAERGWVRRFRGLVSQPSKSENLMNASQVLLNNSRSYSRWNEMIWVIQW